MAAVAAAQLADEIGEYPAAGRTDRMTEREAPTVDVELGQAASAWRIICLAMIVCWIWLVPS